MKILVACEFSGIVRDAFRARGHDAWSCDLIPTERPGPHILNDVRSVLSDGWDMMIAFPPCTHLSASGARWWKMKHDEQVQALDFVQLLMNADIPRIAIENPVGIISTVIRKPDQIIQPWQFGEGEIKTTCLWLKRLPPLYYTHYVTGREQKCWRMPARKTRGQDRARTFPCIAAAMAAQWGRFIA